MADGLRGLLALEGRIAWRHLRAETVAPWVRRLTWVALYTLLVGVGLGLYAEFGLDRAAAPSMLFDTEGPTPLQRGFSTFAFVSVGLGALTLIFAIFARYFSILSTIVIYAVLLGTMSLVVVPSLMSGLMGRLQEQILDQKAHLLVRGEGGRPLGGYDEVVTALLAVERVSGVSPYVEGEVMILSGIDRDGAILRGVVPELFARASRIEAIMDEGSYGALSDPASITAADPLGATPDLRRIVVDPPTRKDDPGPTDPAASGEEVPGEETSGEETSGEESAGEESAGEETSSDGPPSPGPGLRTLPAPDPAPGPEATAEARRRLQDRLDALEDEDEGWEDPTEVLDLADPEVPTASADADAVAAAAAPAATPGNEREVPDPILIGKELASELGFHVGSKAQLITPVGRMTPAGRVPGVMKVTVGGVFYSKMYEYDKKLVYAPLETVQSFLRLGGRVSGVEVRLHDVDALEEGREAIEAALLAAGRDDLQVETWEDLNRNLFAAMYLEKIAMFVALSFVVLVSAFGILTSNLMSVLERYEEIAILKAMGTSDRTIQIVFWTEGLCVGLLGGGSGIGIGLLICWALARFGLPFEAIYYMHEVPVEVQWSEVGIVGVCVLLVVWLFTLYPARIAARMRPVDTLRLAD